MKKASTSNLAEYVVYFPLCYNNGSRIEDEKIEACMEQIAARFKGYTRQKASEGIWISKNKKYHDLIDKIEVLTYDTTENDDYFRRLAEFLKKTLRQKEIFIKKIKVERL